MSILKNICHKLGRCGNKKKILTGWLVCMSMLSTTFTAFAADNPLDEGRLASPMGTVFNFISSIALPIAVLGVGACVFSFFMSNEKGYEIAKKRMFHIGVAVAAIALVPMVVNFIYKSTFRSMRWNPMDANREQIVANIDNRNYTSDYNMELSTEATESTDTGIEEGNLISFLNTGGYVLGTDGKIHTDSETGDYQVTSSGTYVMCCDNFSKLIGVDESTGIGESSVKDKDIIDSLIDGIDRFINPIGRIGEDIDIIANPYKHVTENWDKKKINDRWYININNLPADCEILKGYIHYTGYIGNPDEKNCIDVHHFSHQSSSGEWHGDFDGGDY